MAWDYVITYDNANQTCLPFRKRKTGCISALKIHPAPVPMNLWIEFSVAMKLTAFTNYM
jgi:hypothetical protein